VKLKRKNSRKGTNNNSKGWKSADLIPNKSGQGIWNKSGEDRRCYKTVDA
jgi:hypothetical protein